MEKSLIEKLRKLKAMNAAVISTDARVEGVLRDLRNLYSVRDKAMASQNKANEALIDALSEVAAAKHVSLEEFVGEMTYLESSENYYCSNVDSLLIESASTIASIPLDLEEEELSKIVQAEDGGVNNILKCPNQRELVIRNLRKQYECGKWDGMLPLYFMTSLSEGDIYGVLASVNLFSTLKDGRSLVDCLVDVKFEFVPTVSFGNSFYQVGVELKFEDLTDLDVFLERETFFDYDSKDNSLILNREAIYAFYDILERETGVVLYE